MKADRRLCITADGSRIVEQNDPEAAFLWAGEGMVIPDEDVKRFGLTERSGKVQLKVQAKPEDKAVAKPADKARKGAKDK